MQMANAAGRTENRCTSPGSGYDHVSHEHDSYSWTTEVDGNSWRVRINDFPDELIYSMMIGSENAGDFHNWPETWQRSSDA
jgi:hypothetical protein